MFIAQITQEVVLKMTFSKDERCLLDPPSCLNEPDFNALVGKTTNFIMDTYIPPWAESVVTRTLVTKGVLKGLVPRAKEALR
jgi:hypothetical protein